MDPGETNRNIFHEKIQKMNQNFYQPRVFIPNPQSFVQNRNPNPNKNANFPNSNTARNNHKPFHQNRQNKNANALNFNPSGRSFYSENSQGRERHCNEGPANEKDFSFDEVVKNGEDGAKKAVVPEGKREPQQGLSNWESFLKKQKSIPQEPRQTYKNGPQPQKKRSFEYSGLLPEEGTNKGETPIVAIDCEMVLCEKFPQGPQTHELARISIVNYNGHVLMDQFIRPTFRIINYLTWVSGITYDKVNGKPTFAECKEKIFSLLKNKKIVGHTLKSDFEALSYTANQDQLRDLAKIRILKDEQSRTISLKKLTLKHLNTEIQRGQHSSVEDARACMYLYKKFQEEIEQEFKTYNQKYGDARTKMLQDLELDK